VSDPLLMLDVDIEIAEEDEAPLAANALATPTELT